MADTESKPEKAKKNRSAAYPSTSLADAVEQLKQIHNDLGKGPYDRDSAAKSLGYNGVSGASASKIAALVHYGLIQRMGGGYVETDLGTSIALSLDDDEESRALLEAFKSPTLFAKLLSDFGGKSLPAKLEIVLVRQYRITEQASKDAAKVFRESAEYVGLLKNGFLGTDNDEVEAHAKPLVPQQTSANMSQAGATPASGVNISSNDISIDVGTGLKVVFSPELMIHVATGKFSKGIEQLTKDLALLSEQAPSLGTVDSHEEDKTSTE